MARLSYAIHQPRKTLAALAALLTALGMTLASGASFTASESATAAVSAKNLKVTKSETGAVFSSADKLKPGESASGTVTMTNDNTDGDGVAANFTLSQSTSDTAGPNGGDLSDVLTVTITEGSTTVYSGLAKNMSAQTLGLFNPGDSKTYSFVFSFPDGGTPSSETTGDNAYKKSATDVTYTFDAVQS